METLTSPLVALAILVVSAPVAGADSSADYLASLDKAGITYSDPATATSIGNSICQQLHNNAAPEVAAQAALNANYNATQAGKILYVASHTLCPDMAPTIEKWVNSPN
jgi:20S proteasome alpha/beta subunit